MKYLRLPDGSKIEFYDYSVTENACVVQFISDNISLVKKFFGDEVINYIDIVDGNDTVVASEDIFMQRKKCYIDDGFVVEYEYRIIKEMYTEQIERVDETTGETIIEEVFHPEETERIEKQIPVDFVVAILEKPSIDEDVKILKDKAGIVNPRNMTLEEFKKYHKSVIGKECTKQIENGADVETSFGLKHFSYTLEDQSNFQDLYNAVKASGYKNPAPYHKDGEICAVYPALDIVKIYAALSGNKMYHTTYCNILNELIKQAPDISTVKNVIYGMDIPQEYKVTFNENMGAGYVCIMGVIEEATKAAAEHESIPEGTENSVEGVANE